ncbi:UPAR/Ly6 domain-containing protein bero-like [Epargyreus clarus]|uniref:UPAR/Ly6 domain-containing protein bero-like n=1 Tax=Epargyreus clarus TaxID=520877 RepID=UPI003C2FA601
MARSVALAFAVLLAVVKIGSCLQCYQCNSQSDPMCKDPFTKSPVVDCSTQDSVNYVRNYLGSILPQELMVAVAGAPRYCHKVVMQSGTTVRTCLDVNPNDPNQTCRQIEQTAKLTPLDSTKQIKHCSVCDKDRCNGAASIASSLPLAAVALIASYLYYKQ